jgi:hypothetical protein
VVTLDDPIVRASAEEESGTFFKDNPPPVFVDEIQKAPTLFEQIKIILDRDRKKGQFYMCGSQQFKMMKGVSESLAGRIGLVTLLGLSLRETYGVDSDTPFIPTAEYFADRKNTLANVTYDDVWNIIHRGSMPELKENPDFVDFYAPTNEYSVLNYRENGTDTYKGTLVYNKVSDITHGYLVFMGGDIPLSIVETDAGTGRSIIVFKESYGNAFVPFLTRNFDKIYIADIRTFPFNAIDYISENGITDILFLNNIMTCCSPPRIKNYIDLLS